MGDGESISATESKENAQTLYANFVNLNNTMFNYGISVQELRQICFETEKSYDANYFKIIKCRHIFLLIVCILSIFVGNIFLKIPLLDSIMQSTLGKRCLLPNNYVVWEATRPITDCQMCQDVDDVLVLHNITREGFQQYAYSPRPMIAKGAALHWPAMQTFTFDYFKALYNTIDGAYESVEDECQLLTFKTEFTSLSEVFAMSESRQRLDDGEKPWYVGWSNCHPDVLEKIRSQCATPDFLPADAELARMDYVFVGYQQGAVMHVRDVGYTKTHLGGIGYTKTHLVFVCFILLVSCVYL